MTDPDTPPDRLSNDPRSPHYNAEVLARDVGIRFKGARRPMSRSTASARTGFASPPARRWIATVIR